MNPLYESSLFISASFLAGMLLLAKMLRDIIREGLPRPAAPLLNIMILGSPIILKSIAGVDPVSWTDRLVRYSTWGTIVLTVLYLVIMLIINREKE